MIQNVSESEDEEIFEQSNSTVLTVPVSAESNNDELCSSETVHISSGEESVTSRRSADNEESDYHAQAENNDEFEMHCDLRYVLSDSSESNAERDSDNESDETLNNSLREWAVKHQIPNVCLIF